MFPFKKKLHSSLAFREAVKQGSLIDMQVRPYLRLHREKNITMPLGITPAAYQAFIDVSGEKNNARGLRLARWAAVLLSFFYVAQRGEVEKSATELVYEVGILRLSGFQQTRAIRVRVEQIDDRENPGLIFMLPEEQYPLPQ